MSTLFVTVSGRVVDLYQPKAEDIHFPDIAEHLAKEARYNGGTPGVVFSVAQHLVLGADWIHETYLGDFAGAAAYFLLHDAHEAYFKDEVTPKKRALERVAVQSFGALAGSITGAYRELTFRMDNAIHAAAGLAWPMPDRIAAEVDRIDKRMLLSEWKQLHGGHDLIGDYNGFEPLPIVIEPWPWEIARAELLIRMDQLLPALQGRAAA